MTTSVLDRLSGAQSSGSEDFDFMGENDKTKIAGVKPTEETATSGNPTERPKSREQEEAPTASTMGEVNLEITLEARKRAESPKGLVIDEFMREFKLVSVDIEHLLNGPLPTE